MVAWIDIVIVLKWKCRVDTAEVKPPHPLLWFIVLFFFFEIAKLKICLFKKIKYFDRNDQTLKIQVIHYGTCLRYVAEQ